MATEEREAWKVRISRQGYPETGNLLVDRRIKKHVDAIVEVRFEAEVKEWAASNSGFLHTRFGIRHVASRETSLLLDGLGSWAFVEPKEVFPPSDEDYFLGGWNPL